MYKKLLVATVASMFALSAFAAPTITKVDKQNIAKSYSLKDGSTVYVFHNGKMAMEDKLGKAFTMKEGVVMETKDGGKIMMHGNEFWRSETMRSD